MSAEAGGSPSGAEAGSRRRPIRSRAVWRTDDVRDRSQWTVVLSDDERRDIVDAVRYARDAGASVSTLTPDAFPVPSLVDQFDDWSRQLDRGLGFVLLRRFPVDLLDPADVELAYMGLGIHLGTPVGQDRDATLLGHVRDEGVERTHPGVRFYRTRERQDFHADGADLVGLLCLQPARRGGESRIASAGAIYNEILDRRPDLVEVLYEPFPWDRNDEQSAGEDPFFSLPVFTDVVGTPRVFYIGWYIRDAQRHPEAPRLTTAQLEAMELLEGIANDPTFHLEMDFQPGDVQLLNNAKILHAREAYEDHDDPHRRRHLLRLWLAAHRFASTEDLLRGGIPRQT